MAVISETLLYANAFRKMFGLEENVTWTEMAQNVLIPKDPATDITMEYTTMNGSTQVKQADIVLNTFPLRYTDSYDPEDSLRDLDYVRSSPLNMAMGRITNSVIVCRETISQWPGYDICYLLRGCKRSFAIRMFCIHICAIFV